MNPLYNLGIRLYGLGIRCVAGRNKKAELLRAGQNRALDYLRDVITEKGKYVWVHAASLGEFEQGRPLIERIKKEQPGSKVLLTFFSPSGYEVRKNYEGADAICYLPLDTPGNVKKFLDIVQPRMAVFVKYEFWGNYLHGLARRGIPTYLISAIFRPKQIFFRPWGKMFRGMMDCYNHIFVQDENSRNLLAASGVTNVTVAGDTRFDRVVDIMKQTFDIPECEAFSPKGRDFTTVIAGSSWGPDEAFLLPYFNSHPEVRLIIAPHEVNEERIAEIESKLTRPVCRLSKCTVEEAAKSDCLIVDCYGKLSSLYRYGDLAYIGGGFGVGIHNLNEAAVYGIPVVFGPNHGKFKEARDLKECGGGFSFTDKDGFTAIMSRLVGDRQYLSKAGDAAGKYIKDSIGATDVVYSYLFSR